jgi:hypothetical protein
MVVLRALAKSRERYGTAGPGQALAAALNLTLTRHRQIWTIVTAKRESPNRCGRDHHHPPIRTKW